MNKRMRSPMLKSAMKAASRLYTLGTTLLVVFALTAGTGVAAGQDEAVVGQNGRQIPPCSATVCEVRTIYVTALDTLLRHTSECSAAPPRVLRSIHLAPFTDLADAIAGERTRRVGIPSSPVVMRMEDVMVNPFRLYWDAIKIIDADAVTVETVPENACLLVFSPVTWLGEDRVRVEIVESRSGSSSHRLHIAQRYVFLVRDKGRWTVEKVETGMQS
jgi:hypothetical protein